MDITGTSRRRSHGTKKPRWGNEAEACYRLAKIYLDDKNKEKDEHKALANLSEGVRLEDQNCMLLLANLYTSGGMKDLKKAQDLYEKAANKGNKRAQYQLANLLLKEDGRKETIQEGLNWLTKAYEQGYSEAQYDLANYYLKGKYLEKNLEKGMEMLIKAACNDHVEALRKIIGYYYNKDTNEDHSKIREIIEDESNDELHSKLASALQRGKIVKQDIKASEYWNELGVKRGYAKALCLRGSKISAHSSREDDKAFSYFLRAAELGDALACYNVAYCYNRGKGVQEDEEKAFTYLKKAVELGYTYGYKELAKYYEERHWYKA